MRRLTSFFAALGLFAAAPAAAEPPTAPAGGAEYSHLYQSPLFVTMFAFAQKETPVDESALRYYASLRNTQRVDAEIRRLKALHPGWTPPSNVYAPAGNGNDEQPFWDLFAADRMNELHAGIALREKREPGWKPSRELEEKIRRKEAAAALVAASDASAWPEALRIADEEPAILNCSSIDAAWRVAEAFLALNAGARAFEIYQAILTTCTAHDDRLTTVRKAISRFPVADVKRLIAMGAKMQDGTGEFDSARVDLTRARMSAVNAGKSSETIEAADLEEFFAAAERGHDKADFALAGWWEYRAGDWARADRWFALGLPAAPDNDDLDAKFALGHGLSLLKLDRPDEARRAAWDWRGAGDALRDLYVSATLAEIGEEGDQPVLTDAEVADFAQVVRETRSFDGATALGWRNLKFHAWDAAALWFRQALGDRAVDLAAAPGDAQPDPTTLKAVEGEILALSGGGRLEDAADIAEAWRTANAALADAFLSVVTTQLNASERGRSLTPHRLHVFADLALARRSQGAAAALGWYDYRLQDWTAAADWFASAIDWSPDRRGDAKLNQGLALALKSAGRLSEAEDVAWAWRDRSGELRAVYVSVMIAELTPVDGRAPALDARRIERFAGLVEVDRSAEGAKALGWRSLGDPACSFAAIWFRKALAWSADGADDAKTTEGLVLSLRSVGRSEQAEDLAYGWRDRSPALRDLYRTTAIQALTQPLPRLKISEARLARFSAVALAEKSAEGAQALGWRRYDEPGEGYATQWFRLAALWAAGKDRDAKTDEGLALALRRSGRLHEAAWIAAPWVEKSDAMRTLYVDLFVEELSRDNPPEPVDESRIASFVRTIEPMRSPLGAQALAWYRLERGEQREAANWFERALDWWPTVDAPPPRALADPGDDFRPIAAKLALMRADYRRTPRAYASSSIVEGRSTEPYVETAVGREKTWQGYALALRSLGRTDESEKIAFEHRLWPPLRRLSIDIAIATLSRDDGAPISEERLRRYRDAIVEDRSAAGADALAWRAYRHLDYAQAVQWFQTSLEWVAQDPDGKPDLKSVGALVASLRELKRVDDAVAIASRFRALSPAFDRLYFEAAFAAFEALPADDPIVMAKRTEVENEIVASRSVEGATAVAWYLYRHKDYPGAVQRFRDAVSWRAKESDTGPPLEGLALALCAQTGDQEYCSFAYAWRDASSELQALYANAMMDWLAKAGPESEMPAEALANFESFVVEGHSVAGAEALGWRYSRVKAWTTSLDWFRKGLAWGEVDLQVPERAPDDRAAKTVEGYVQALRFSGDVVGAEDVAWRWRERSPELRSLYFQTVVQALAAEPKPMDDPRVTRFAEETAADRSVDGAQNLGWLAYRDKDFAAAVGWFERGLSWTPEGEANPKAYEGYALALLAAGRLADAEATAWKWRDKSPELRAVFVSAMVAELAKPDVAATLDVARIDRLVRVTLADRSFAGAQAIAWWKLSDEHCADALPWFRRAAAWSDDGKGDAKTNEGLALSLDRLGRSAEAEDVAYAWADRAPDMRTLYLKIGAIELTRDWPRIGMSESRIARYTALALADHSSVGLQALAWKRYAQAGEGYSARWFRLALAWSPQGKGDAKLNEGYALSLRALGRNAAASDVVYPWIAGSEAMKKLFIDVGVEELSRDNPPEPMDEDRLSRFAGVVEPAQSALGAQAIGWYRYERGETEPAIRWFKAALDWWPKPKDDSQKLSVPVDDYKALLAKLALTHLDYRRTPRAYPNASLLIGRATESYVDSPEGLAKTVQGYALALRAAGRLDEAETLAYAWRDRWPPLRALFLDIAAQELAKDGAELAAEKLERYRAAITQYRSANGAVAFAWRAYRVNKFDDAAQWFSSAIDWRDPKTDPDEALVEGQAMALRSAKRFDDAQAVVERWSGKMPELRAESIRICLASLDGVDPTSTPAAKKIAALASATSAAQSYEGAESLGWMAYQRKEWPAAEAWFRKAIEWAGAVTPEKSIEGYARTLVAEGRTQDAFTFADRWSARSPSMKPIFVDIAANVLASPPEGAPELSDEAVQRAGEAFAEARSETGAQSLAWARLRVKDYATAVDWFKASALWSKTEGGDPKTVEGLLIALRGLNRNDEAETLAYSWAKRDENLRAVYIEIVAGRLTARPPTPPNADGMKRFAEVVVAANSASGAEALGWYSYNTRQIQAAASWFEKALAWAPDESSALGAALSYKMMGDREGYVRVVNLYRMQYAKVAELATGRKGRAAVAQRAALEAPGGSWTAPDALDNGDAGLSEGAPAPRRRAAPKGGGALGAYLKRKDYGGCIAQANKLATSGALKASDAVVEGWCLLGAGRPAEATRIFDFALYASSGPIHADAAYGKSLALLQAGRANEAVDAAGAGDLSLKRRNDIGVSVLAQRADEAYRSGRYTEALQYLDRRKAYAPETRDLMQLRAWSLHNMGQTAKAAEIFRALDAQLSTDDTNVGANVTGAKP